MKSSASATLALTVALLFGIPVGANRALGALPEEAVQSGDTVPATPELVREVQFMLQTLGIDPGPLDGNARALTNRAVHQFEVQNSLPIEEITNGGPVSTTFLGLLRKQATAKITGATAPPAQASAQPPAPVPAPAALPPPPDRFASCPYEAQDFLIGGKQFTPQAFLDDGFGGSTDRAVASLQQRLNEARDLAGKIGGAALTEVQRQSRVLAYFQCRQKIEQAAASK